MSEIIILGAGVAGLCVANEFIDRGCKVTIVEPYEKPGSHACSWWAGGMLTPWCERVNAEEPVLRLGKQAIGWWQEKTGLVQMSGSLVVAPTRDNNDLLHFAAKTSEYESIESSRIDELEPDLAGRFNKALYFTQEGYMDPRAALLALYQRLKDKQATIVRSPPKISNAITIDCRGLEAADKLEDLRGVKGEMLTIFCPELSFSRPIRLLHPRIPLYLVPRGNGLFMLGATMIESNERDRISARSMLEMLSSAYALHPALGEAKIVEIGVDARPAFPDNLPRIINLDSVLYVNGLYRHGYLLGPALATMAADYVLKGIVPEFMDENHC